MLVKLALLLIAFLLCGLLIHLYVLRRTAVVEIDSGPIQGKVEEGVQVYLGIPYAAPPIGELRWKAPKPVVPWKGVRVCTSFGFACPQAPSFIQPKVPMSEDCLTLNVWSPTAKSDATLPVMVWLHGGKYSFGSADWPIYDGKPLAKKGVVVVSLNYRLGAFGFLAHARLSEESSLFTSGNYGLLDQIAALQWIQKNIALFGGDPNRVTLFGESSGAACITALMISDSAKGLFSGAICESGTIFANEYLLPKATGSLDQALLNGEQLASMLGCERSSLQELRKRSWEEIVEASQSFDFGPVFDGVVLPKDPKSAFCSTNRVSIPLLIGVTENEGSLFCKDAYEAKQLAQHCFLTPAQEVAGCVEKAYFYVFRRIPPTELGRKYGSFHAVELPYVFGTLDASEGFTTEDYALSEAIMNYWVQFAKKGTPNGPDLLHWPKYQSEKKAYLVFDTPIQCNEEKL